MVRSFVFLSLQVIIEVSRAANIPGTSEKLQLSWFSRALCPHLSLAFFT